MGTKTEICSDSISSKFAEIIAAVTTLLEDDEVRTRKFCKEVTEEAAHKQTETATIIDQLRNFQLQLSSPPKSDKISDGSNTNQFPSEKITTTSNQIFDGFFDFTGSAPTNNSNVSPFSETESASFIHDDLI